MGKGTDINMAPNITSGHQAQLSPAAAGTVSQQHQQQQNGVIAQTPDHHLTNLFTGLTLGPPHYLQGYCPQVPTTQALSVTPGGLTVFPGGMPPNCNPYLSPPGSGSGSPALMPAANPEIVMVPPPQIVGGFPPQAFIQQPGAPGVFQLVGMPPPGVMPHQQQHQTDSNSHTPTSAPAPAPPYQCSQRMEVVWQGEFQNLFSMFGSSHPGGAADWRLVPTAEPPDVSVPGNTWHKFQDSAKVRFCCQKCGKGWTSMKGRVAFWFSLDADNGQGVVLFKLYGQVCERCQDGVSHSMWYPEEVQKVINNVFSRVGQVYYGFPAPKLRMDRRQGKPRSQHNSQLCQACKDGMCLAVTSSKQERSKE